MSQDEMVFEDVTYRAPERRRRPDRDRALCCLAYEVPRPNDLPVFLARRPADAIERHALRDVSVELGGILLGKECVDDQTGEPFVVITESLEAKHYENTQASFTYTHDSWEEITRERDRLHPDLDIVGWYHTHPDFGVFLSSMDVFIHQNFFAQPLQVAYVVDPIRQTRSFFQWRNRQTAELGGFYLTADRAERPALARLANDLEQLPNPEGPGGGISPRLEAELIAMLSRQSTRHDYAQTTGGISPAFAALLALLGAGAGVVGLAAVLWLNQLSAFVADQARATGELEKSLRETAERQRIVLDSFAEVDGQSPKEFLERYNRAARARDEARLQLRGQQTINDTLAARTKSLTDELSVLKTRYEQANKLSVEREADAKEAVLLRPQFADLKAESARQARTISDLEKITDTPEGHKARDVIARYDTTWYSALAGWTVAGLLSAAGVGYFLMRMPPEDPTDLPPATPTVSPEPTPHRIT